jgi:dihydrofolate reductase
MAARLDENVGIWGGADIIRQYLKAGFVDEFEIYLVPILLTEMLSAIKVHLRHSPGRLA